ncbi:MAG: ABC transporter permease [Ardenticatenaceae bacterium]|nr:ABC transporter permease [Ardenticatenaceae bacterium]
MNNLRYTLAVAGKELQVMLKDRGSLVVLFLLPLLLASLLGSMYQSFGIMGGDEEQTISLDVFLVNGDDGEYAKQVVTALESIDELNITTLDSAPEADERVADAQALAAIIIPADFSQKIDTYEPTQVQVIVDPAQEVAAGIISGIMNQVLGEVQVVGEISYGIRSVFAESGVLEGAPPEMQRAAEAQSLGAIMTQLQAMRLNPTITVRSEDMAGLEAAEPVNVFGYVVPNFTVMFSFFLIGVIAATLLREKEEGSFRRLIAAPLPHGTIIAGKMLAYMLVVVLQVVILFGVASFAFGMPLGDSPLGLLLLTIALAMSATALGLLLAAWAKTSSQADSLGTIIGFVLAGLGGCIVSFSDGSFMEVVSKFTPHGHALAGFYGLLNGGFGVVDVLPQVGWLVGFTAVFFIIAMWRFRFE